MKMVSLALMLLLLAPVAARADQASKKALIDQYLRLTRAEEVVNKTFAQLKDTQAQQMELVLKQQELAAGEREQLNVFMKKIYDAMEAALSWKNMEKEYVAVYDATFTEDELQAAVQFYKTPLGKEFAAKTLVLNEKLTALGEQKAMELLPLITSLTAELFASAAPEPAVQEPPGKGAEVPGGTR